MPEKWDKGAKAWQEHVDDASVSSWLSELRCLLFFLRNLNDLDRMDFQFEQNDAPPPPPKKLKDRCSLAWKNFNYLWHRLYELRCDLSDPLVKGSRGADTLSPILDAMYAEFDEDRTPLEFEVYSNHSGAIKYMKHCCANARRIAEYHLTIAIAGFSTDSRRDESDWSRPLLRKEWMPLFDEAGYPFGSEDSFDRHTANNGIYPRDPAYKGMGIKLLISSLPLAVKTKLGVNTAPTPH